MNKWLKVTFFVLLLVGAGYFFGTVCRQIGQAYSLILSPSEELLSLLLYGWCGIPLPAPSFDLT